jgi:hypothetical protein
LDACCALDYLLNYLVLEVKKLKSKEVKDQVLELNLNVAQISSFILYIVCSDNQVLLSQ